MPVDVFSRTATSVDSILAQAQLETLQNWLKVYGTETFCRETMWVLRKKAEKAQRKTTDDNWNKRLVPFKFNRVQSHFTEHAGQNNDILKYRQAGFTTYGVMVRLYLKAVTDPGFGALLISQTNGYGAQHFGIIKRTHRYFCKRNPFNDADPLNLFWQQVHQHLLHTAYSARRELVFDFLDSRLLVNSAQNEEVGQGLPGLSAVWATEVARWPRDPEATMANVSESVHHEGTIDKESTANMMGGYFYEDYQRAKLSRDPNFQSHFYPWPYDDEYREKPLEDETILTDKMTEEQLNEEAEIKKVFQLDAEQITWRRRKIIALRHEFAEKYPEDDITCFLLSGKCFFDTLALKTRKRQLIGIKPYLTSDDGMTVIYQQRRANRRYVIGADPSSGKQVNEKDTDFSAAVVIDQLTGVQVAGFMARLPPEEFGVLLAQLGRMYNNAMVGVERIGDGGTVMLSMAHEGYSNIYEHVEWDKKDRVEVRTIGWPPTQITRPLACNRLATLVREHPECVLDERAVDQFFTFTRNGKTGKPEASTGSHDDYVSAFYIAEYVRLVNLGYIDPLNDNRESYGQSFAS